MIIALDCETTGLLAPNASPIEMQPYVIELCAIKFDAEGNQIGEFLTRIKPSIELPEIITKITGIRDRDLINSPSFIEILDDLSEFFVGCYVLTGHNLAFDRDVLANELIRYDRLLTFPWPPKQICTVLESKKYFGYRLSLARLHRYLFDEDFENAHSAKADVLAQSRCFFEMVKRGDIV
jgi:DNA polymerase III epsilon subunit-like protein